MLSIDPYCCADCVNAVEVTFNGNTKWIGECAFLNNCSLNSIVLPQSVEYIGERAFDGCSSLTSVAFPRSEVTIKSGAFAGTNLQSV